ncbi:putative signal peptidase I [Actinacidiphila reveromycinica]|uniref:Signal peptidase I n=1 Tax=Actinacidiphila reveromycinica TaxID=659352 RepID=A0A7U3VR98_9ACTN|nr:signal peptidase I [Streptomyces sp. SN-593]BBB00475.1 putative signal peptidase I [Streptomyces sp. SN-593]
MSATRTSGGQAISTGRGGTGHRLSGIAVALGCVLFLGGFAWAAIVYRPYTVPTDSMEPTVRPGDKVLAERVSGDQVHRGDIVVFKDKLWGDLPEVKRVVGVGGDTVSCCDAQGRLMVDGKPVQETYLAAPGQASASKFDTKVPKGELFLVGDNRAVSQDSRLRLDDAQRGAVPAGDVKARVEATAWPLGRAGAVARTSAFDGLSGGGASSYGPLRWLLASIVAGVVLILGGAAYPPLAGLFRRRSG